MLLFLLKLTFCWTFFALLYGLLLRGETFFRANRFYLLGTVLLGILLSLDLSWLPQIGVADNRLIVLPTVTIGLQQAERAASSWLPADYVWVIYLLGAGFMLLRFGWAILRLLNMAVRGQGEVLPDGCLLLRTNATTTPFSFFKWIFVPLDFQKDALDQGDERTAMLIHERAHAQGWHSADVLLLELLCIVFWFHPLVHWYRRALRNVHEYLADAEASRRINLKQYGLLLIRQSQPGMPVALVHHFFQSPLKQRFIMLTKKASAPTRTLKYGLLLPLTLLFVLLFRQAPVIAQTMDKERQEYISNLESSHWIQIDTVTVYDPTTQTESVKLIKQDLGPYKEPGTGQQVYQICEKMPEFPGGQAALMQFLVANIHYPPAAKAEKAQAMVVMRFIVGADGSIRAVSEKTNASNVRADFVQEAKRVIELMPKWTPGEQKGKKVVCEMALPIRFKLD